MRGLATARWSQGLEDAASPPEDDIRDGRNGEVEVLRVAGPVAPEVGPDASSVEHPFDAYDEDGASRLVPGSFESDDLHDPMARPQFGPLTGLGSGKPGDAQADGNGEDGDGSDCLVAASEIGNRTDRPTQER